METVHSLSYDIHQRADHPGQLGLCTISWIVSSFRVQRLYGGGIEGQLPVDSRVQLDATVDERR